MMKHKLAILAALCLSAVAWAQSIPTSPAGQLSGTVTLGVSEGNLLASPYASDIPGVSTSADAASVSVKFTDGSSQSYLDSSRYMEEIRKTNGVGYEASVTFDAANLYSYVKETTKTSSNGDSSFYSLLQPMIDWYENNYLRFGMKSNPSSTTTVAGQWPTTAYDSSTSGRTRFIYGHTAQPMAWIAWDSTKWYDAQKLVSEIKLKIEYAIDAISPDASNGKVLNQWDLDKLPTDRKAAALKEVRAWYEFHLVTDGADVKATLTGPNFQSAYLRFTNVLNVMDIRVDFAGAKLSTGKMIPSPRAAQGASGAGLSLALPTGLVPNLDIALRSGVAGGTATTVESPETRYTDYYEGEPSWVGVKLDAAYRFGDVAVAELGLLFPDVAERPLTLAATAACRVDMPGTVAVKAQAEGNIVNWQRRLVKDAASEFSFSGGADIAASVFGLTPHALGLYKAANYWGVNGNDMEDRFPGTDLRSDFDSCKVKDALAVDGGLSFNPAPFIDAELVKVDGGYRILFYDLAKFTTLGQGWYAGIDLNLADVAAVPVSLSATLTNYQNWGPYAGVYSDWSKAPAAGLFTGLTWTAALAFDPTKDIRLSLEGSGRESGYRMDTQRLVSLGAKARIKF